MTEGKGQRRLAAVCVAVQGGEVVVVASADVGVGGSSDEPVVLE